MERPPTGPAPVPVHWQPVHSHEDLTDKFREEALEAVLLVVQDLVAQDLVDATPLPSFWGNGLYAHMHAKCCELFSDGYIVETKCRHSPVGWRWEIVRGARRTHARFVAASITLIETFTHALIGHGASKKAITNVTFWALLECARHGLWMRAMTTAHMLENGSALLAGLDPAWLVQRSADLRLDAYANVCACEFKAHCIWSTYEDFLLHAVDIVRLRDKGRVRPSSELQ